MEFYHYHTIPEAQSFQVRPEFHDLISWWKASNSGVCTIWGHPGTGKSSLVAKFLEYLSFEKPEVQTGHGLVFSFLALRSSDRFLMCLAQWLNTISPPLHEAGLPDNDYDHLFARLGLGGLKLIVLDGFETQQSIQFNTFGEITDLRLANLLRRASSGQSGKIKVIITSRVPVLQLSRIREPRFKEIAVDAMPPTASISILRPSCPGVPSYLLERLAVACGFNALRVTLAAGFVAKYGLGPLLQRSTNSVIDKSEFVDNAATPPQPEITIQTYLDVLRTREPLALTLLERLALFRMGASEDDVRFLIPSWAKEFEISSSEALTGALDSLLHLRLLQRRGSDVDRRRFFVVPPLVTEVLVEIMDSNLKRSIHLEIQRLLMTQLEESSSKLPQENRTLDIIEELIYHTIQLGLYDEAWEQFENLIGGYKNLNWRLGQNERGERLCRMFLESTGEPENLIPKILSSPIRNERLMLNFALYLQELGILDRAVHIFETLNRRSVCNKMRAMALRNIANVELLLGRISAAVGAASQALEIAQVMQEPFELRNSWATLAYVRWISGNRKMAGQGFRWAAYWQRRTDNRQQALYSLRGLRHSEYLLHVVSPTEAIVANRANKAICNHLWPSSNPYSRQCDVLAAWMYFFTRDWSSFWSQMATIRLAPRNDSFNAEVCVLEAFGLPFRDSKELDGGIIFAI